MGVTIFWSLLAIMYFVLSVITFLARKSLIKDLSTLDDMSPTGVYNAQGKVVAVESRLYNALKAILITDIIGFFLAAIAAIISPFI